MSFYDTGDPARNHRLNLERLDAGFRAEQARLADARRDTRTEAEKAADQAHRDAMSAGWKKQREEAEAAIRARRERERAEIEAVEQMTVEERLARIEAAERDRAAAEAERRRSLGG